MDQINNRHMYKDILTNITIDKSILKKEKNCQNETRSQSKEVMKNYITQGRSYEHWLCLSVYSDDGMKTNLGANKDLTFPITFTEIRRGGIERDRGGLRKERQRMIEREM